MSKIKLSKPIQAHGEEVTELEIQEPTTGDLIDLGDPMSISDDSSITFKNDVIAKYISRLAKIPMSSVRELSRSDFTECKTVVAGFLGS